MKRVLIVGLLLLALTITAAAQDAPQTPEAICEAAVPAEEPANRDFPEGAEDVLEDGVDYSAVLCTEEGPVYVELFETLTPTTVNNFVFLAQQGYYNNTTFHRVLENFMAQAGDPTGTGAGGPGYQFRDEPVGFLTFDRPGLLAMANAGPDTNGSQFFITTAITNWLDYNHTIFGEVLQGQDNVLNLRLRDPQQAPDGEGAALETVVIITDPASIETDFESASEPATAEAISGALEELSSSMPEDVSLMGEGITDTAAVAASAPEELQDDYAAFLETYGHQFRVSRGLTNDQCNPGYFFTDLRYTIDAFESEEAAAAALADPFLAELATAQGYTNAEQETVASYLPVYEQATQGCDDIGARDTISFVQRGRYLVTVGATVNEDILTQVPFTLLLERAILFTFESALIDQLAGELLQSAR